MSDEEKREIVENATDLSIKLLLPALNAATVAVFGVPIPIGSYAYSIFNNEFTSRIIDNLEYSIKQIEIKVRHINRNYISEDYFKNEFPYLFYKLLETSQKEKEREKIDLYISMLSGALAVSKQDDFSNYQPEEYLESLSKLSIKEVEMLKELYSLQRELESPYKTIYRDSWDNYNYKNDLFNLKRLESVGFIKEITGGFTNYTGGIFGITEETKQMFYLIEQGELNNN